MDFMKDFVEQNYKLRFNASNAPSKVRAHVLDTSVSNLKFKLCMKTSMESPNHAYIGTRLVLENTSIIWMNKIVDKEFKNWDIFMIFVGRIYAVDTKTKLWSEFIEEMETFGSLNAYQDTLEKKTESFQEYECMVCFGTTNLIKCLKCTSRYCFECFTKDPSFNCYSCGLFMGYNHHKGTIRGYRQCTLQVYMASLFKMLEKKFGLNMQSMYNRWNKIDVIRALFQVYEENEEGLIRYFDMESYISTLKIQLGNNWRRCDHEKCKCAEPKLSKK